MQDLVDIYFEPDRTSLSGTDSYYCITCQEKTPAIKSMVFSGVQEILIIQMMRFNRQNTKFSSEITGKLHFVAQNVVVKILTLKHLYSHPVFCF